MRRFLALVASLVLVGSVAACSTPLPEPVPEPAPTAPTTALTDDQINQILTSLGTAVSGADTTHDPAGLASRVTGPALLIRTAEYGRFLATSGAKAPQAIPVNPQVIVAPSTDTWPRTAVVVTEQPEDLQAPRVLVLVQATPQSQYQLWGAARQGPGIKMPATALARIGSPVISATDGSSGAYAVPLNEVAARYADVLNLGDASAYAADFAPDFFRTALTASRDQVAAGLAAVATVAETTAPAPDAAPPALQTATGGALVFAQLTTTTQATVTRGSITLSDPYEVALAGVSSVTHALTRTWTNVVVFYVPPASTDEPVQVLAGEHMVTGVTGS